MAQVRNRVNGHAAATPGAAVAPTATELVAIGPYPLLAMVTIVGTATTITVNSPGAFQTLRAARAARVIGTGLTNTRRWFILDPLDADAAGNATVVFSQVVAVTWELLELNPSD
jgi:hypothetical protein